MKEVYKTIIDKYAISNCGNIINIKTGKQLKKSLDKYGYYCVCLSVNNKRIYKKVHRLVAMAFIENTDNKPCIDHIDGNKTNNQASNLRWVTPKENTNNPITMENIRKNCTPPIPIKKEVLCITTNRTFESTIEASKYYKLDASSIGKCCRGERKKCGGYEWQYT